jgi:hypothetical protein
MVGGRWVLRARARTDATPIATEFARAMAALHGPG